MKGRSRFPREFPEAQERREGYSRGGCRSRGPPLHEVFVGLPGADGNLRGEDGLRHIFQEQVIAYRRRDGDPLVNGQVKNPRLLTEPPNFQFLHPERGGPSFASGRLRRETPNSGKDQDRVKHDGPFHSTLPSSATMLLSSSSCATPSCFRSGTARSGVPPSFSRRSRATAYQSTDRSKKDLARDFSASSYPSRSLPVSPFGRWDPRIAFPYSRNRSPESRDARRDSSRVPPPSAFAKAPRASRKNRSLMARLFSRGTTRRVFRNCSVQFSPTAMWALPASSATSRGNPSLPSASIFRRPSSSSRSEVLESPRCPAARPT